MGRNRRNLRLNERIEDVRTGNPTTVQQFELSEIKAHYDQSMALIEKQFDIADKLNQEGKIEESKAILRSQVVFLQGVLDFYIHEISKYALYHIFKGEWNQTERYNNFLVPMFEVEKAIESPESKEWFFSYLNKRFSREVFLSAESLKDQLNLIGIEFNEVMSRAFPRDTEEQSRAEGKEIVMEMFVRRNSIAHQLDRKHETAEQEEIDKEYVNKFFENTKAIVTAIHTIAESKG